MTGDESWSRASDPRGWKELMVQRYGPRAPEIMKMEQQRVVRTYIGTMEVNTLFSILL